MTHVHNAVVSFGDGDEQETFIFSSLDGENWLPVSRRGESEEDAGRLARLFEGDGNFKPMVFTRRFLAHRGATFEEI
jgi:hypothetical protein